MAKSSFYSGTGTTPTNVEFISSSKAAAEASENAAAASAAAAAQSATQAETSNTASNTAKVAAQAAQTAAETAETNSAASAASAATSLAGIGNSETNAATSASNSAASASAAAASALSASSSATSAASDAASAATSLSNIGSSETNAAASATAAASSATSASTDAASASASQVAAAASEAAAATSEANSATSETNAATSASQAATSATNSATSEANAATSASSASTSASNAASSASSASASQVAAAASAASAANAYDTFDDRYLGSKTADPTVDNDGNALVQGSLYFNSTANEMRVYDGGSWIAASSAGGASLLEYKYTATAAQTTFSGADDNANTLSYTQDNLIVTLNGVVLENGADYTATTGTSVVLASGAAANDELNVIAFKSFTTADMVSSANGGTFYNNIDVQGTVTADGLTVEGSGYSSVKRTGTINSDAIIDLRSDNGIVFRGSKNGDISFYEDTGTTAKFFWDASAESLGIGTSSPAYKLDLQGGLASIYNSGAAANSTIAYRNGTKNWYVGLRGDTSNVWAVADDTAFRMSIDSSGDVGIGMTSPDNRLSIASGSDSTGVGDGIAFYGSNSNKQAAIESYNAGNYNGDLRFYTVSKGSASTSVTEAMRIDSSGNLQLTSVNQDIEFNATTGTHESRLKWNYAGTLQSWIEREHSDGSMVFGNQGSERMRIDSSGNVKIGTTSAPSAGRKLLVSDTSADCMLQAVCADGSTSGITFGRASDFVGAGIEYNTTDYSMRIYGHDYAERMRIDSSGNVGINESSPDTKLHVSNNASQTPIATIENTASHEATIRFKTAHSADSDFRVGASISASNNFEIYSVNAAKARLAINSNGDVAINGTGLPTSGNAGVSLQVAGNVHCGVASTAATDVMRFDNPNGRIGSITVTGTSTSYNTSSDYRLKENVTDVTDGITRVKQLAPKRFNFIANPDTTVDGFIAHEAQAVVPEAVTGTQDAMRDEEYEVTPAVEATFDEDGNVLTEAVEAVMGTRSVPDYQGIDQSKLVPLLTAALQEAIAKIETLETEMTSVKARLDALETN